MERRKPNMERRKPKMERRKPKMARRTPKARFRRFRFFPWSFDFSLGLGSRFRFFFPWGFDFFSGFGLAVSIFFLGVSIFLGFGLAVSIFPLGFRLQLQTKISHTLMHFWLLLVVLCCSDLFWPMLVYAWMYLACGVLLGVFRMSEWGSRAPGFLGFWFPYPLLVSFFFFLFLRRGSAWFPTNQSINHSINQSINRTNNQAINQTINDFSKGM